LALGTSDGKKVDRSTYNADMLSQVDASDQLIGGKSYKLAYPLPSVFLLLFSLLVGASFGRSEASFRHAVPSGRCCRTGA
jgi:hypothetical protein